MTTESIQSADQAFRQTAEGLQVLNKNLVVFQQWGLLIPLVIWLVFRDSTSPLNLLLWCSLFYLVMLPRLWIASDLSKKPMPMTEDGLRKATRKVMVSSLLGGIVWGASTFFFFGPAMPEQQVILLTIVYAVSLLSMITAVYWLPAFYSFVTPVLGGQILYFGVVSDERFRMLAVVSLLLLLILVKIGRNSNRLAQNALSLKFRNLRLVEKLTLEKNRVEFACKSKSRFLAAASHDLRQPVHSLTMLAEALRGEAKGQVVRELVDNVSASVDSLDELLTDLLDISRLDAAVVKVRKLPVNIRPVIESIVDDLRTSADAKNIYIRTHISDTFVYSDPVLLGTVIRKLLVNAVQFTQRGGVLVGLRKRGDTVLVQVWDSGPGIAHENSEDIFVEFYRIDGSGREGGKGLGLGLPISKRLSDLLGHELRFSSRPGKGSVFEIRLQCIQQQKIIPVHAARSARQVSLSGRRLLVVDNEVAILQGTLAVLKNWQCEVSTATNAKDALALVKSGAHFDGYLCDYDLGSEMNGIALLEQLQALDGGRTPGIIITGNTDLDFIRMAADAGHTVLHKPVKPAQLRALLMRQSQLTRLPETYA